MTVSRIISVCLAVILSATATLVMDSEQAAASTTFIKVSVQAIDSSAQTLTFRTASGETWTLAAASPDLLHVVQAGDVCSLEIDSEDRVVKVVKTASP